MTVKKKKKKSQIRFPSHPRRNWLETNLVSLPCILIRFRYLEKGGDIFEGSGRENTWCSGLTAMEVQSVAPILTVATAMVSVCCGFDSGLSFFLTIF